MSEMLPCHELERVDGVTLKYSKYIYTSQIKNGKKANKD